MYIRCIGSETISVIDSGAANRRFESRSGNNKRYDIDIRCFSSKHTSLRKEDTDGFVGIRIICQSRATFLLVDCCICVHYNNPTKRVGLIIIIS